MSRSLFQHYGSVTTSDDGVTERVLPMHEALADIGEMVERDDFQGKPTSCRT